MTRKKALDLLEKSSAKYFTYGDNKQVYKGDAFVEISEMTDAEWGDTNMYELESYMIEYEYLKTREEPTYAYGSVLAKSKDQAINDALNTYTPYGKPNSVKVM